VVKLEDTPVLGTGAQASRFESEQAHQVKKCTKCLAYKAIDDFQMRSATSKYRKSWCQPCCTAYSKVRSMIRPKSGKQGCPVARKAREARYALKRTMPLHRPTFICIDTRRSDKRRGLYNDLTPDFVEARIAGGCRYCGEKSLQMTLDRIDNGLGHLKDNVQAACIRCNLLRGHMPYDAWLALVPAVRATRIKGLFGDWTGQIHTR
jgi:hypothetical protein